MLATTGLSAFWATSLATHISANNLSIGPLYHSGPQSPCFHARAARPYLHQPHRRTGRPTDRRQRHGRRTSPCRRAASRLAVAGGRRGIVGGTRRRTGPSCHWPLPTSTAVAAACRAYTLPCCPCCPHVQSVKQPYVYTSTPATRPPSIHVAFAIADRHNIVTQTNPPTSTECRQALS